MEEKIKHIFNLISKGHDINAVLEDDSFYDTPLHAIASYSGTEKHLQRLLEMKADPNVRHMLYKTTPLHVASDIENAKLLIESGADILAINKWGQTPFHTMVEKSRLKITDFYLRNFSYDLANMPTQDEHKSTALHIAVANDDILMVTYLLEMGVNPNLKNAHEMTPLHIAAENNLKEITTILLEYGADINKFSNKKNVNALHQAIWADSTDAVSILLDHGGDPNLPQPPGDNRGSYYYPFHAALYRGAPHTAKMLLNAGADPKLRNPKNGKTSLMYAIESMSITTVICALEFKNVDTNQTDFKGRNALYYAIKKSNTPIIVNKLLEHGLSPDKQDEERMSLLHHIDTFTNSDSADALIKGSKNLDLQDKNRNTPLHIMVSNGSFPNLERLVEAGANPFLKNKDGKTPSDLARGRQIEAMVSILEKAERLWKGKKTLINQNKPSSPKGMK